MSRNNGGRDGTKLTTAIAAILAAAYGTLFAINSLNEARAREWVRSDMLKLEQIRVLRKHLSECTGAHTEAGNRAEWMK